MMVRKIIKKIRIIKESKITLKQYLWNLGIRFNITNLIPDKQFIKIQYYLRTGRKLNLNTPISFNEKIQWLKLYCRNPEFTNMVDKYEAKRYVSSLIGEEYIIPTFGIYKKFDDIDFGKLPNSFVIKCTHDSGGLVIVKNKDDFNILAARKKINKCLHYNFYYAGREWAYKNVKPRIIIEKYMEDKSGENGEDGLFDYKIFCFNGNPKIIQVDYNRFVDHHRNLYDVNWNYINAEIEYPTNPEYKIKKPALLEKMLELAAILSNNIPLVRVDFYYIQGKIYFGELTLYHGSGMESIKPETFANELGNYITLPHKTL